MWEDIYVCECDGEAVAVYDWPHDNWVSLALWRYGAALSFGWRWKLRHVWYIIRYGHPYVDDVILSAENARSLGEKLIELAKESNG